MKFPRVTFQYDMEKDIDNIVIGLGVTKRGRNPDKVLAGIIAHLGDNPHKEAIGEYLSSRWENRGEVFGTLCRQMQSYWDSVEVKYFDNILREMQLGDFSGIKSISGFFSSRYGCGYNFRALWFAVSLFHGTLINTRVAMHEIMHIFFHKKWWDFCLRQGLPQKNIWDVKEAVTVLLNVWFRNELLDEDLGYEEHAELRYLIKKEFLKTNDFKKIILRACDYMKKFPEKSPSWVIG